MTTTINTKLGTNKNTVPRIWIEGYKLLREGIHPCMKYVMRHDREIDSFVVTVHADGVPINTSHHVKQGSVSRRKVRGTDDTYLPLLEIATQEFRDVFANNPIRVVITGTRITISIARVAKDLLERLTRFRSRISNGEPMRVMSQFHGGGVMDLAAHYGMAKHKIASYVRMAFELDGRYLDSSLQNNPELWRDDSLIFEGSIENFNPAGANVPKCELLIVGLPCTAISLAGRAKTPMINAEDHQDVGHMLFYFLNGALASNPAMILIENVPQMRTSPTMSIIRNTLRSRGYVLSERILNGNDFGALECRDRFFCVAVSEGMPEPNLAFVAGERAMPASLAEVLEDLGEEHFLDVGYLLKKEERDKKKGSHFEAVLVGPEVTSVPTICKGYSKVRSGEPYLLHPDRSLVGFARKFSAVEHARIKTIPTDIVRGRSQTVAHEIMGQSVIFEVVRCLMGHLAKQWRIWIDWGLDGIVRPCDYLKADESLAA
ncbi:MULTISPECIES: DNA cytosine methyltransferase [Aeromonas]|uniref:DNA (cytosine-5-)-methyltransferase n=1 Tax=Aeromonas veronii TaxID=654 RepID=A0A4S5CK17_AERVE|nr:MULTISPECIES: DNA cytosine methyltransferase [Aeromonas]THJ43718.1 DNA cytosine methyltransferase [Aeromonas veronii]